MEQLYSLFASPGEMSLEMVCGNILMAALLGFLISVSYLITHAGTGSGRKFDASLTVLTVLTGTVMTVIGSNPAIALGMVGVMSVVRFRTAIRDSRDTLYLLWAATAGICCGVGNYVVAAMGSGVVFVVLLIFGTARSDNRMMLIIRASREKQRDLQTHVYKLFGRKAVLRVRNTTAETAELIYVLTAKSLRRVEKRYRPLTESLYELGGVEYVNVVMQNDELSA